MSLAKPAGRADAHSVHLHPLRASPTSQTFTKYPLTTRSLLFSTAAVFTVSSAALFHSINPIFTLSASLLTSRAAGSSLVFGSRRSASARWNFGFVPVVKVKMSKKNQSADPEPVLHGTSCTGQISGGTCAIMGDLVMGGGVQPSYG